MKTRNESKRNQSYAERYTKANNRLANLMLALKSYDEHDAGFDPTWGDVGTMTHINEILKNACVFMNIEKEEE